MVRDFLLSDVWETQEYLCISSFSTPQYWSKDPPKAADAICVVLPTKKKAARLLQQSDGAPRFGKHGLQLCSV